MNKYVTDFEFLKNIKIDKEFAETCPELSDKEFETLEENILSEGEVTSPIYVWNNTMIDGHHRRQIILKHPEIPFQIKKIDFNNKYEAIAWICKNQIGRRNLNHDELDYLIGKRYEAEKQAHGDWSRTTDKCDDSPSYQNDNLDTSEKTCERIAKEYGIGSCSVIRDGKFSKGIDAGEDVCPGIKRELLSGDLKAKKSEIIALGQMEPDKVADAISQMRKAQAEKEEKKRKAHETKQQELEHSPKTPKAFSSISELSANMAEPKPRNNVSNVIGIINDKAQEMKETCERYITEFPELLEQEKPLFLQTLRELKEYIDEIYKEK